MNSELFFDDRRDIQDKSSSTFWGISIKIQKLISRVATLMDTFDVVLSRTAQVRWKGDSSKFIVKNPSLGWSPD